MLCIMAHLAFLSTVVRHLASQMWVRPLGPLRAVCPDDIGLCLKAAESRTFGVKRERLRGSRQAMRSNSIMSLFSPMVEIVPPSSKDQLFA
jgi:hypothetical protein